MEGLRSSDGEADCGVSCPVESDDSSSLSRLTAMMLAGKASSGSDQYNIGASVDQLMQMSS